MRLSYVIISSNRKDSLLATLGRLAARTPLPGGAWDVWVVDNGSTDGTAAAVQRAFPSVKLICLPTNEGTPARNHALNRCTGEYVICLVDDSYPQDARAVGSMLNYLDEMPGTAAVVANVRLADGSFEAPAFPSMVMSGATCFRRSVLQAVGGYSPEIFGQAEEYDLSLRIWNAGFRVERFEDVVFMREKVRSAGRADQAVQYMDFRNTLIVADRFLPENLRRAYSEDWTLRCGAIGRSNGFHLAMKRALWGAWRWSQGQSAHERKIMHFGAIESVFGLFHQRRIVKDWASRNGAQRVVIADFSKNLFATWSACMNAGLEVVAVADDGPAFRGLNYRGKPVLPLSHAFDGSIDGVVMSNINPAHIDERMAAVERHFSGPVLRLWEPKYLHARQACLQLAA